MPPECAQSHRALAPNRLLCVIPPLPWPLPAKAKLPDLPAEQRHSFSLSPSLPPQCKNMQKYFPFAMRVKMSSHASELTCNAERSDAKTTAKETSPSQPEKTPERAYVGFTQRPQRAQPTSGCSKQHPSALPARLTAGAPCELQHRQVGTSSFLQSAAHPSQSPCGHQSC